MGTSSVGKDNDVGVVMNEAELVRAAVRDRRWDDLVELSERFFGRVCLTDPTAWAEAFSAAPEAWMDAHPRQRYLSAMVRSLAGNFTVVNSSSVAGMHAWIESQETPLARDLLGEALGRLQFFRVLGRFGEAAAVADEIERIIATTTEFTDFDDILPSVLIPVGTTRLLVGDIEGGITAFAEAERWSRLGAGHPARRHARNYRALAYALGGNFARARAVMEPDAGTRTAQNGTLAYIYENASVLLPAVLAVARLDRGAAEEALELIDEDAENDEFWWLATLVRARFALYWGDREGAVTLISQTFVAQRVLAGPDTLALTLLSATLSDLQQATGDLAGAAQSLQTSGIDRDHPAVRASLARLQGDPAPLRLGRRGSSRRHPVIDVSLANFVYREHGRHEPTTIERAARSIRQREHLAAVMEADLEVRAALAHQLDALWLLDEATVWPSYDRIRLSEREREILLAIAHDEALKSIAGQMFLSVNTVKTYLRLLYRKLQVNSRHEAVEEAKRLGLLIVDTSMDDPDDWLEAVDR